MKNALANEYSAILKDLLHYLGLTILMTEKRLGYFRQDICRYSLLIAEQADVSLFSRTVEILFAPSDSLEILKNPRGMKI